MTAGIVSWGWAICIAAAWLLFVWVPCCLAQRRRERRRRIAQEPIPVLYGEPLTNISGNEEYGDEQVSQPLEDLDPRPEPQKEVYLGMNPNDGTMHRLDVEKARDGLDTEAQLSAAMAKLSDEIGTKAAGPFAVGEPVQDLAPRLDMIGTYGFEATLPHEVLVHGEPFVLVGTEMRAGSLRLKMRSRASMAGKVRPADVGEVLAELQRAE